MSIEILAPAGSAEHLKAAVYGGADGVYLGTKEFSARSSAVNFSLEELEESVAFCHSFGVCVYVAVNTALKNSELEKLLPLAKSLAKINADGVIVQDLAVAEVFRKVCPQMPLHGSTQMAVHNLDGALTLKQMGFSRVVLARELSFEEIEYITKNCGIETEVFVHGAHCMSVSGMCYMSSFIGGRSGNRGRCAQPCRLDFKAGGKSFCLSLKDMSCVDYVEKLEKAGVASLKIEGRMKRPEYAYMASKTYKRAILGENFKNDYKLLYDIFSRSGFTDGYMASRRDGKMFGYRKKEDVEASADALKSVKIEPSRKIKVKALCVIKENEPVKLTLEANGKTVCAFSDEIVTKSTHLPQTERIESALTKTGGTSFEIESFNLEYDLQTEETDKAFSISAFNGVRRNALDMLYSELSKKEPLDVVEYNIPAFEKRCERKSRPEYRIRVEKACQLEHLGNFGGKIIIPYNEADKLFGFEKENIILELPILVYPFSEEKLINQLVAFKKNGYNNVLCENIAFIKRLNAEGFKVYGGAYLNVINPLALNEYKKLGVSDLTLSLEINAGDVHAFSRLPVGVVGYGYVPLMHFRVCPNKAAVGCDKCGGNGVIKDRLSKEFSLLCKKDYTALLNTVPISLSGKELAVDFVTLYFTKESSKQVKDVLDDFIKGNEPTYPHTKGLYFRKVL